MHAGQWPELMYIYLQYLLSIFTIFKVFIVICNTFYTKKNNNILAWNITEGT